MKKYSILGSLIYEMLFAQSILIKNAWIHNGKGDTPYVANIFIKDKYIQTIQP